MDIIFHEKQQGSLCAQHCLNALLQGPYFSAIDLAEIGRKFDEEERSRMAEAGISSEEFQRFLQEPSSNMDDSGYFSVQVISAALSNLALELIPFNSSDPRAVSARLCPTSEIAYICHYRDHWFSIRKLGNQWFNLNSVLPGPELLSDTYLSLFLAQLQTDKYSIFIVVGHLPNCEADRVLKEKPLSPRHYRKAVTKRQEPEEDDDEFKAALEMSRKEMEEEDDHEALNKAIMQSLQSGQAPPVVQEPTDEQLRRAISMSLEAENCDSISDSVEFIRQRRLMRLGQIDSTSTPNNP